MALVAEPPLRTFNAACEPQVPAAQGDIEELVDACEELDGLTCAPEVSSYSIVGTWSDWGSFTDLAKVSKEGGGVYAAAIPVRGGEVVELQVSLRRSFQRIYYPESPAEGARVFGPSAAAHGRNWQLAVPSGCSECIFYWDAVELRLWWEFKAIPTLAEVAPSQEQHGGQPPAVALTSEVLCEAMCDLAVAYSDSTLQRLLQDIRGREDFLELLRELILPRQAAVLQRLGLPVSAEGLNVLESRVVRRIVKESHLELQRMANGALRLLRLPPCSSRLPDPLDSAAEPLEALRDERRDFWRSLCPWLHVGALEPEAPPLDEGPWHQELIAEGYFVVEEPHWAVDVGALARGVSTLTALGLPAECLLVYDEPWVMAAQLAPFAREIAGEVVFDWRVSRAGDAGPQRGQGPMDSSLADLRPDGTPRCSTLWIALTDATPERSCLMVVPRKHDAGYAAEHEEVSEICGVFQAPEDFQHITAVPVAAGGVVGISHRLFHWESQPCRKVAEPTLVLALGVAERSRRKPCLREDQLPLPTLATRLALVAALRLRKAESVEQLALLWELFCGRTAVFSESFCRETATAREERYEQLEHMERGPTIAGEPAEPMLFEASRPDVEPLAPPRELRSEVDPFELLMTAAEDRKFWQKLCPWLHVCDDAMAALAQKSVWRSPDVLQRCSGLKQDLIHDGFFSVQGGLLPWAVDLSSIARGVMELVSRGFPALCILMYDEPWILAAQVEQLARVATGGNQLSFDWAAFCVRAQGSHAKRGWPPHRDRGSNSAAARGFRADGTPRFTTFWIALTDATPLTSCLHMVPRDPGYRAGDGRRSAIQSVFQRPSDFRRIRAVPLAAGGLLGFSHRVFHWGSAAHPRAAAPRVALAFPAVDPSFEAPMFPDPAAMRPLPPLEVRLGLMAAQVLVYAANETHLTSLRRLEICWSLFSLHSDAFRAGFYEGISETNTAQHQRLFHVEANTRSYVS